ncbi:Hypothetical protein POVR2_LOCUS221 [uncultured virus]|nr:Hypothetical protein POVR2_LOCUS221 [uncultured virus]
MKKAMNQGAPPGSSPSIDSKIQAKAFFLAYYNVHISKREYRAWMEELVVKYTQRIGTIDELSITSRSSPAEYGEKWTYVILLTTTRLLTRSYKIFTWKGILPEVRVLKRPKNIDDAIDYLENWTYTPPRKKRVVIEKAVVTKIINAPVPIVTEPEQYPDVRIMSTSDGAIEHHVSSFSGWQEDILRVMNERADPNYRRQLYEYNCQLIDMIHGPPKYPQLRYDAGKINRQVMFVIDNLEDVASFLRAIKSKHSGDANLKHNPERFLVLEGIPCPKHLDQLMCSQVKKGSWTGECIIFDMINYEYTAQAYDSMIEASDTDM